MSPPSVRQAVFAIIFLTDEPDKSPEGAQAYVDAIIAAKAGCGGTDCVLAAGLVNEWPARLRGARERFIGRPPRRLSGAPRPSVVRPSLSR